MYIFAMMTRIRTPFCKITRNLCVPKQTPHIKIEQPEQITPMSMDAKLKRIEKNMDIMNANVRELHYDISILTAVGLLAIIVTV